MSMVVLAVRVAQGVQPAAVRAAMAARAAMVVRVVTSLWMPAVVFRCQAGSMPVAALAVRAAAFHLPPALLPAAYLFLEARGAHLDDEAGEVLRMVEACLVRETDTVAKLRMA